NITLSAVSVQQAGEASGVNNTLRQVGSSFGSAIIGAVIISVLTSHVASGIVNSSVIPQQQKGLISEVVHKQISVIEFGGQIQLGEHIPAPITNEIINVSKQATVDAVRTSLWYAAGFAFLG